MEHKQPTEEEIGEMADEVLCPTPIKVKFAGFTVEMSPLPYFYAKNLIRITNKISTQFKKAQEMIKDGIDLASLESQENDFELATTFYEACEFLLNYYKEINKISKPESGAISISTEILEKRSSVAQAMSFLNKQTEVNGKHDFLLQPLSAVLLLTKSVTENSTLKLVEALRFLSLSVLPVKLGEPVSST